IEQHDRALLAMLRELFPGAHLTAVLGRQAAVPWDGVRVIGTAQSRARIPEMAARASLEVLRRRPSLIVCGHLNYAPLGEALARGGGGRLGVCAHGIGAWSVGSRLQRHALRHAWRILAVSQFTADRLRGFGDQVRVVPNTLDLERFRPGPPAPAVAARLA